MFPLPCSLLLIEPGKPFCRFCVVLLITASLFLFNLLEFSLQNVQDAELNSDAHERDSSNKTDLNLHGLCNRKLNVVVSVLGK
jgi:hypothetical protein